MKTQHSLITKAPRNPPHYGKQGVFRSLVLFAIKKLTKMIALGQIQIKLSERYLAIALIDS